MFWCNVSTEKIKGAYEVESTSVTGLSYRKLLIRKALPVRATLKTDCFQHDGTSPRRENGVRARLNQKRNNYRIEHRVRGARSVAQSDIR